MNRRFKIAMITAVTLLISVMVGCGEKKPPSRDHFPEIKNAFYLVQEAVRQRDRYALDSLMSTASLSLDLDSDSLLSFVYGEDGGFERFGDYRIVYTDEKARIDCFINDSTGLSDRPFILTFVLENEQWLLKRFEAWKNLRDST